MTRRQWFALSGAAMIALLLAFPLQDVIREAIIVPLAYFAWVLGVLYQSIPQSYIWLGLVFVLSLFLLRSLTSVQFRLPRRRSQSKPIFGQVEALSESLARLDKGNYYKWQVANRLGRLARDFLILLGEREERSHRHLSGSGWQPEEHVDKFIDVGLRGSFAQFPSPRFPFMRAEPTPLDVEVDDVLDFLETQIKKNLN